MILLFHAVEELLAVAGLPFSAIAFPFGFVAWFLIFCWMRTAILAGGLRSSAPASCVLLKVYATFHSLASGLSGQIGRKQKTEPYDRASIRVPIIRNKSPHPESLPDTYVRKYLPWASARTSNHLVLDDEVHFSLQ